ncbi:hypothetical protein Focb16_v001187 [Fusarium oxysporum f. sp. cubense]|uniref:Uncharacterized protein n=1 Tax=Fusarium oxysporum f. sp. cubense TaxID=61366 RepID=A0A559LAS1_FUSOC|nr:hypothetical protein Focb16_v001187 [Fusarium oxysporum f. sp. cubense]
MKEAQQKKSKPGPPPGSEIPVSDSSNDLAQEPATFVNVDQLLEQRNHQATRVMGALGPLVSQIEPQRRPDDESPVAATRLSDSCDNKATSDSMESQCPELTVVLDNSRSISPQETSKVIKRAQSSLGQLVSLLQRSTSTSTEGSDASEIAALQDLLDKEQQNNQSLTGDHENLTREYKRLDREHGKKMDEIHETNERLHDALLERDQLRQLLEGGTFANSAKTADSTILGTWKQLAYKIRNLAHILAHTPDTLDLGDVAKQRLRFLSNDYVNLLKGEDYIHALMQGYLWALLEDRVFQPNPTDQPIWGGSQITCLKLARDDIYCQCHMGDVCLVHGVHVLTFLARLASETGKNPDYLATFAHAARCFSQVSTMYSKLWDDDHRFIEQVVSLEAQRLQPFFLRRSARLDRTEKKISEELKDIIHSAVELDKMMMCSKARFMIEWKTPAKTSRSNARYNREFMEAVIYDGELGPKSRVKFFTSPILLKAGTADGQKYNTTNVLAKASVVCN